MNPETNKLRIGTRGSKLALIQTEAVRTALHAAHPGLETEIVTIKSSGDWKPAQGEVRLSEQAGGKGQFIKEIEEAITDGRVDIGVHSLKDVPSVMERGLTLNHFLPRGDVRDVFISTKAKSLDELPEGAVVGTSSVRRQSVILNRRPDLKVTTFRGNIDTRLEKLAAGQVDAIILAAAGLKRISREDVITSYIEPEAMLPAVGQGVIAIQSREGDTAIHAVLEAVNHMPTRLTTIAERTLVTVLNGSCGTPIGAYALFTETGEMRLRGFLAQPDGSEIFEAEETALIENTDDAYALGLRVGRTLKSLVPEAVLLAIAS